MYQLLNKLSNQVISYTKGIQMNVITRFYFHTSIIHPWGNPRAFELLKIGSFHLRVKCVIVYVTQSSLVLLCSRTEEVEKNSQLRTRAMREAEKRPSKTYRFTLVRIRLPDGIILQGAYFEPTGFSVPLQVYSILLVLSSTGTFYSREKLQDVFEFVRQSLVSDWQPFLLFEAGRQLKDENATLVDLGLVSKKRHFQKVRFDYVYFLSSLL